MAREVIGYVVGFACAVLAALVVLALALPLGELPVPRAKQVALVLGSLGSGFAAAWTGDGILGFFDLHARWPFFAVLVLVFLVVETQYASTRRLALPLAITVQLAGLAAGWWTLPR